MQPCRRPFTAARRLATAVTRRASSLVVALLATTVGTLLTTGPAQAQIRRQSPDVNAAPGTMTLLGIVHDSGGTGLEGTELRIGLRRVALSDGTGAFAFFDVPFDTLRIEVRRIGFKPASVRVVPAPAADGVGQRVELDLVLAQAALRLSTVIVDGLAVDKRLNTAGFYRRQKLGAGRFLEQDEIERFGGDGLASLLREMPRIIIEREAMDSYAYGVVSGMPCRMNIFVDGRFARYAMPASNGSRVDPGVGLDQLMRLNNVQAIEVYPSVSSVPSQYQRIGPGTNAASASRVLPSPGARPTRETRGSVETAPELTPINDAACGAIAIWTKPPVSTADDGVPPPV